MVQARSPRYEMRSGMIIEVLGLQGKKTSHSADPLEPHFHLYSKDLPRDGVNGLGRPTRIDIINGLVATGDLVADQPTLTLKMESLDVSFPVYPDGAVTLRLPIKNNGTVNISYMTCSETRCMPPYEKTVEVRLK